MYGGTPVSVFRRLSFQRCELFTINIADITVLIDNKYEFVKTICKDYIIDNSEYDFVASVSENEFAEERKVSDRSLSDGFIESVCIYRNIAQQLPFYDAFVMHCASVEYDGSGYCFTAKSGTGKTTHIRLWRNVFGSNVLPINGDKPIVRLFNNQLYICGTPWSGKEMFNRNVKVPLNGICVLSQAKENAIVRLNKHEALTQILSHVFFPAKQDAYDKTIDLVGKLINDITVWHLSCNISEDAARLSFEAMCKKE